MKASFYIWLARNSSVWCSNESLITIEDANFPAVGSKNTSLSRDSPSSNAAFLSSEPTGNFQHTKHPERETHVAFEKKNYSSGAFQLFVGLSQGIVNQ